MVGLAVVGPTWGVGMNVVGITGAAGLGVGIEVLGPVVVGFCEVRVVAGVGLEVLVVGEVGFCEVRVVAGVGFEVLGPLLVIGVGFCEVVGVGRFVAVVGDGWDVGLDVDGPVVGPCNLRLIDFETEMVLAVIDELSVLSKSSFSFRFIEQGVQSLFQTNSEFSEFAEPGAYPSFEHMSSSEIH